MRVNIVVWNHIVYRIETHEPMYMVDAIMKEFFYLQYIARLITACVQQLGFDFIILHAHALLYQCFPLYFTYL